MLVADDHTNPCFQELCDAAKEIAELKAQISRLEKLVDGVLAQHLAGQNEIPAALHAPDAPLDITSHETDGINDTIDRDHTKNDGDAFAGDLLNSHSDVSDVDNTAILDDTVIDNWNYSFDDGADTSDEPSHDEADPELHLAAEDESVVEHAIIADNSAAVLPTTGSLPSALRSLICRPLKSALTSPDDLTLIEGIDCATALELTAFGLSTFEDIADLDAQKIEELRATVTGSKHLHKQGWIAQAAILATGDLTAFARQTRENRAVEDTTFTLKPELIAIDSVTEDKAPDFTASEIILDEKISFDQLQVDQAACVLNELAIRNMPRQMYIDRQLADIMCCKDERPSFLPMAATDAGFAIEKIAHTAPKATRDFGNMRALVASLGAAAVIYIATATSGVLSFDTSVAQLMETDVCALTSWSSYPDACKQILGRVL